MKFAIEGLKLASKEQTFRIFCIIAVIVVFLMFFFNVSLYERLILVLIMTFVMVFELINSRIERILDIFQPNHDSRVKFIKDISAGAVLLACVGALVIGILIFWPHFLYFLKNILK